MRSASLLLLLPLTAATWSGCASVSPRPDRARAEDLPVRDLTAEQRAAVAAHVERAMDRLSAAQDDAAQAAAAAALAIDPRCARARAVLGLVSLHRAQQVEPPDLQLANAGEVDAVLAEQLAPQDAFVGWAHAVFLAASGHVSAAATIAEAAIARTGTAPADERAALLGIAGHCRYELGEERAALPLLQAYIGLRPDSAEACFRIGRCLLRVAETPLAKELDKAQRDVEAAVRAFTRCAELAPDDADAALAIGAAMFRAGEIAGRRGDRPASERWFAAAADHFRALAERWPTLPEASFRLGVVAEQRQDEAGAAAAYGEALRRHPEHLGSLLNLAALAERGGDRPRAEGLWRTALRVGAADGLLTDAERAALAKRLQPATDPAPASPATRP